MWCHPSTTKPDHDQNLCARCWAAGQIQNQPGLKTRAPPCASLEFRVKFLVAMIYVGLAMFDVSTAVPTVPQHHLFHMTAICCSFNAFLHRIDKLEGRVAKLEHENAKLVDVLIQALSAPSSPATEDTVPPRTAASFKLPVAQHTHVSCSASNDTANTYAPTTIRWLHGASCQSCRPRVALCCR